LTRKAISGNSPEDRVYAGAVRIKRVVHEGKMKQPNKTAFDVHDEGSTVVVTFTPTKSYFTYARLHKSEWDKHGKISKYPKVRHAKTGDTGEYVDEEVSDFAYNLAVQHAN
jgi:hypothetical protein